MGGARMSAMGQRADLDVFTTPRLLAERLTPAHLTTLRAMHADPTAMASIGGTRDEAATQQYLAANLAHWERHGFGIWALREQQTGAFVGRAGLRRTEVDGLPEVELAYALLPAAWGRGLATEAGRALQKIAASRLGLLGLVAWTRQGNRASQRVLVKLGFCPVGDVFQGKTPRLLYRWNVHTSQPTAER